MCTFARNRKAPWRAMPARLRGLDLARFGQSRGPNSSLDPQQSIEDQAAQGFLQSRPNCLTTVSNASLSDRFGHNFSRVPVLARTPPRVQARPAVNTPGDLYEREADRISEQMMRVLEPQLHRASPSGGGCPECRDERSARGCSQAEHVQADAAAGGVAPPIIHEVLRSPGQALTAETRALMESRFGHDFGPVRVHTDPKARRSAETVNARAYTVGQHIVFGTERYAPESNAGKLLLAHELVHVIQQGAARAAGAGRAIDDCFANGVHAVPRVTQIAHDSLQRASSISNPELKRIECEARGVPCPQGIVYPKTCRITDCIPAATARLPFAISPGICIFECSDGSMCTCVLVGTRRHAFCTFRFCTSPGQAANTSDIAERARLAVNQAGQGAGSPTAGEQPEALSA